MNLAQRVAVGLWAAFAVGIIFLHNPISGYGGMYYAPPSSSNPIWNSALKDCQKSSLLEWNGLNNYEETWNSLHETPPNHEKYERGMANMREYQRLSKLCVTWSATTYPSELQSLDNWYSEEPLVSWLRTVPSFLWAQACIAVIAGVALFLSRGTTR